MKFNNEWLKFYGKGVIGGVVTGIGILIIGKYYEDLGYKKCQAYIREFHPEQFEEIREAALNMIKK